MLKQRLREVANLVTEDSLIDIGTDHGYLIIDLLSSKTINSALAVEITKGPLDNVKKNIKGHRLLEKTEFALSDGLKGVDIAITDKYQAVSICGMGGSLISKILTDSISKINNKVLYLQPNNGEQILRSTLVEIGFTITNELVVCDNDIFYEIIKAVPGRSQLTEKELYFGPINIKNKTVNFTNKHLEHYNHMMKINKKMIENNVKNQKIINELELIRKEIDEII